MAEMRAVWAVGRLRWRSIVFTWRTAAILALMGIYIYSSVQPYAEFCRDMGVRATPWVAPFMMDESIHQLFFMLGAVALFAGAPFRDAGYPYTVARAGRKGFAAGNMLGIVWVSAGYAAYLMVMSVVPLLGRLTFSDEWGKVWNTLAMYQSGYSQYYWNFGVSDLIRISYSPGVAMGLTFCLETLCVCFMGMCVYMGNLLSQRPIGMWVAGGIAMVDISIYNMFPDAWNRYSPPSLARLSSYVRKGYMPMEGSVWYGVLFFCVGILAFCAVIGMREGVAEDRGRKKQGREKG